MAAQEERDAEITANPIKLDRHRWLPPKTEIRAATRPPPSTLPHRNESDAEPIYTAHMADLDQSHARSLAEESREHLRRIRKMFEATRLQAQLARQLIAECHRFSALIEDMEAQRILELHDGPDA
jgi:hypothetical protein